MLKIKKILFLVLFVVTTQLVISQEQKTIKGKVTYENRPLLNVHVVNQDGKTSVKTDAQGAYSITAKTGDEIIFTYVGMKSVKILVEDITSTLNIKMTDQVNQLDDVVVKARVPRERSGFILENEDVDIITPTGTINPKKSGFSIVRINGDRLASGAGDLMVYALDGKTSGLERRKDQLFIRGRPASYMVDDSPVGFVELGNLDLGLIKDIYVIKNQALIVIHTINHPRYIQNEKKKIAEKFKNQNYYDENSVVTKVDASQNDLPVNFGEEKEIYGKLTYLDSPVPNVTVAVAGKKETRTFSDAEGLYRLKVQVGDIVQFTHVSFETTSIVIEDVTEELNLELLDKRIDLDEVALTSKKKRSEVLRKKALREEKFNTSRGEFDPKKMGFSMKYAEGKNISHMYENIQQAVVAKIPGLIYDKESGNVYSTRALNMSINQDFPMVWEIDGLLTSNPPPLDLSN